MRVFITGATGYIGGAVARAVHQAGHAVIGLARSERAAAALTGAGYEARIGDTTDVAGLAAALAGVDAVIHTAVGMSGGVTDADHAAVDAMIDALAERGGTLILTSGLGVYFGSGEPWVDEGTPLDDALAPQRARVDLEERVLGAADRGVRAVVFRPAHVFGGGRAGIFTRTLLEAARTAGEGVYVGEGTGLFGVVHVDDLADAYLAALTRSDASGRYNLVAQTIAIRDLATAMSHGLAAGGRTIALTADEAHRRWVPLAHGLLGGPMVSSVRATTDLGWSPSRVPLVYELVHGSLRQAGA